MKCAACNSDLPAEAAFCPRCGTRLQSGGSASASRRSSRNDLEDVEADGHARLTQPTSGRRSPADDPEVELWHGTFSPKAMLGTWIGLGCLSLVVLGLGIALVRDGRVWGGIVLAILAAWIFALLGLVYRRLSIRYRLTSQRLFQERGLLTRTIDRVEVIDMHDITFEQGILERMLGVGTIRIKSSDRTDPDLWMRGIDEVREVAAKLDAARRREQVRRSVRIDQI